MPTAATSHCPAVCFIRSAVMESVELWPPDCASIANLIELMPMTA